MPIYNTPDMNEREEIVKRLQRLSARQRLIEQAYTGYAHWYQVAPKDLAPPQDVGMTFRLQTLYFQPGVATRLPAYITTTVELTPFQGGFGLYSLFTNVDGSYRDDVLLWASLPATYGFQRDYGIVEPPEPVELRNVPKQMQDIFPRLTLLAQDQQLVRRAVERCSLWFQRHPDWYLQYPLSLTEEGIKKDFPGFALILSGISSIQKSH